MSAKGSVTTVGRPWLQVPLLGVRSISRRSASISAGRRRRPRRTEPWQAARESREWLTRVNALLDDKISLTHHLDILDAAGWLTLLVGTLEYDTGQSQQAEATRIGALQLAGESRNAPVAGWAHEMRAWFALTSARYDQVIEAARMGRRHRIARR